MSCRSGSVLVLAFATTLACTANGSGDDGSGDDGSDGTTSQDSSGGPAGGPGPACELYIECAAQHTPVALGELIEAYGPDGVCWQGDGELAETCAAACAAAVQAFEDALGPDACAAAGGESSTGGEPSAGGEPPKVELGDTPCVLFERDALADFVTDDGTALTCSPAIGDGVGALPDGLSVDSNCEFSGSIAEERVGAWAQIIVVGNDNGETYVPFCAMRESTDAGYSATFSPGPLLNETFVVGQELNLGTGGEPSILVTAPAGSCPTAECQYQWTWSVHPSAVGIAILELEDDFLAGMKPVALSQVASVNGPPVPASLTARPWVAAFDINYCFGLLADCEQGPIADDAFVSLAFVMTPAR